MLHAEVGGVQHRKAAANGSGDEATLLLNQIELLWIFLAILILENPYQKFYIKVIN